MQEECGPFSGFGLVGQDADGAVGMEAVNHAGAGDHTHAQTLVADGHAPVRADLERGAAAPDVRPPRAARHGPQHAALFALGDAGGGVGRALEFAMDFVGVAVAAQGRQERVGRGGRGDGFGGEEGGQAPLPVLMLTFDLALGLGRARVTQGDAIEVERGPELGQGVGALGKEQAVAVHVKFQRQAVLGEGGGQEVEVGEQILGVINGGPGADARAVIEQVEERIVSFVAGEPAMGRGVELPERADFQALPAADRGGRTRGREGMSQVLRDGPAAHGGGIDEVAQTALHFGGGAAIRGGRLGGEEFAQQGFSAVGPVRSVVAAGGAGRPAVLVVPGDGAQIIAVKFVEAGAAQAEFVCGGGAGEFRAPESGEDFTDQRSTEAGGKLAIMFFIAARMAESARTDQPSGPALRA